MGKQMLEKVERKIFLKRKMKSKIKKCMLKIIRIIKINKQHKKLLMYNKIMMKNMQKMNLMLMLMMTKY